MGVTLGFSAFLTFVTTAYGLEQYHQARRRQSDLRRDAREAASQGRGLEVRPTLANQPVPYIFGMCFVQGIDFDAISFDESLASPSIVYIAGENVEKRVSYNGNSPNNLTSITAGTNKLFFTTKSFPANQNVSPGTIPTRQTFYDAYGERYSINVTESAKVRRRYIESTEYDSRSESFTSTEERTIWEAEFLFQAGNRRQTPDAGGTLFRGYMPNAIFGVGELTLSSVRSNVGSNGTRVVRYNYAPRGNSPRAKRVASIALATNRFFTTANVAAQGERMIDRNGNVYILDAVTVISNSTQSITRLDIRHGPDGDPLTNNLYHANGVSNQEPLSPDPRGPAITDPTGVEGRNQFLVQAQILGLGRAIIYGTTINNLPDTDPKYAGNFSAFPNEYGQPNLYLSVESRGERDIRTVSSNDPAITSAPLATGMTYVTSTFKISIDPEEARTFSGQPSMSYYVNAYSRFTLSLVDGVGQRVERPAGDTFPSIVLHTALYELLTSGEYNKQYIKESDIDTTSFAMLNHAFPENLTNQKMLSTMGAKCVFSPLLETYRSIGANYRRYIYCGQISTTLPLLDQVTRLLESAPGLLLFQSLSGKFKLSTPAVVRPSVVPVITDSDVILDSISGRTPNTTERLNTLTITFPNIYSDFSPDTITYAPAGLLTQDGGQVLSDAIDMPGVVFPQNVYNNARWIVLSSRLPTYQVLLTPKWWSIEKGDIMRLTSTALDVDEDVRVIGVEITTDQNVQVNLARHIYADWTWIKYTG